MALAPTEFVILSATGSPMITVTCGACGTVTLTVKARRNGDPVTITTEEAADLAAALTRRWPMCGPPSPEAPGRADWRSG